MAGNRTIPRLWRDAVARNTGTAYLVDEGESWREVSWREAAERVELLANGLLARGVGKGDAFSILRTMREPDAGMAAAGDVEIWGKMIDAALTEAAIEAS